MSAAKQFKTGVSERSGPEDWRGGLERSHARRGGLRETRRVCAGTAMFRLRLRKNQRVGLGRGCGRRFRLCSARSKHEGSCFSERNVAKMFGLVAM